MEDETETPVASPAVSSARLDAPPPKRVQSSSNVGNKVQQPKPQALPSRSSGSAILVSPRQKGNPILNNVRAMAWEYADIPADYVLGATTCALFLSLKYHKLHPEYIYNRIKGIAGKYNLRIVLTMVDIAGHEEPIKELTKTSLINNVTIILCWSAQEAARYLELYKSYENAAPTSIRANQATSYSERVVEFITTPRSINKTDAVGLISMFGSVRNAVNATPEQVSLANGWGEKKVQRWCSTVREGFRPKTAKKRKANREDASVSVGLQGSISRANSRPEGAEDEQTGARLGHAPSASSRSPIGDTAADYLHESSREQHEHGGEEGGEGEKEEEGQAQLEATVGRSSPRSAEPKKDKYLTESMEATLKRLRGES